MSAENNSVPQAEAEKSSRDYHGEQPPGGEWDKRNPSYGVVLKSLFRRSWLVKIRNAGTIVSEIIATCLIVILVILYNFAATDEKEISFEDNKSGMSHDRLFDKLPIEYEEKGVPGLFYGYEVYKAMSKGGNLVALPNDSKVVHDMVNNYYYFGPLNLKINESFKYVDGISDVKHDIETIEAYTSALSFDNDVKDTEWYHDLKFQAIEHQSLSTMLIHNIRAPMKESYKQNGIQVKSINDDIKTALPASNPATIDENTGFSLPTIWTMRFSKPGTKSEMPLAMAFAMYACLPIVIASMPDLTMILQDKESHMLTFILLMGAPESAYWIVSFVSTFVMCIIPYTVLAILFCTWLGMKGTNFVLLYILMILFIMAFTMFQAFLSTFFTSATSGRVLTVIFIILIVFFAYLNEEYTLEANDAVKHVFSLFPIEPFEMMISVMYEEVRNKRPALGFGEFTKDYRYPVYYCFMWSIFDIIIWGLLFLLFNATNDRGFGSPPLKWSDIFHLRFKKYNEIELDNIADEQQIMKVDNLVKRYKGKSVNAVDDVSFTIKKGEIIVMIGPNGAGKSSIINTISGAIGATGGTLTLGDGEPSEQFSGIQDCLGIVFQENVIINLLSIREHLEIFGRFRGIDEQVLQEAIDFFADNLQLREMLPNRAGDLSGGQKRKLCIALSLLGNPPIIIMDEPTAGVDVQARQLIWKSISTLKNSTCIITTHALEEAEAVSSRMFVISRGKIPFAGTSTELREEFKCGYVMKIDCAPEAMEGILAEVKKFVPEAAVLPDRDDTIAIPVSGKIPELLESIEQQKEKLGVEDFSFAVEQLEDVLLRILETN